MAEKAAAKPLQHLVHSDEQSAEAEADGGALIRPAEFVPTDGAHCLAA